MANTIAAAVGGSIIGSAVAQDKAAKKAKRAQMSAAERARGDIETGKEQYDLYMDDAELDLDAAYDKAMGLVDTGMGEMKTEYEGAIERFDPYAQQGKKALDLYMDMFSGGDGGSANIINTPMFQAQQGEMNKQIAAQMAAT